MPPQQQSDEGRTSWHSSGPNEVILADHFRILGIELLGHLLGRQDHLPSEAHVLHSLRAAPARDPQEVRHVRREVGRLTTAGNIIRSVPSVPTATRPLPPPHGPGEDGITLDIMLVSILRSEIHLSRGKVEPSR
ncbi:hypothetical protein DL766_008465 [Monosporascus sp. MC13-8B]|uniref:Uncharacterized protein n=1 Tax=Monosporascus cannonballus TaxID=155416 RepID=A0ABY0H2S1_9PEZI|nr:hypothetical protein DL762_006178 [Monosporascus cannonballus]RYO88949.1 hypothetical protein DL763_005809 [Monosporascus cannonballus]RYP19357.1 hypothetical protein DL766_008465 [Monosporascus sp. MC13-8B]